MTSIIISGIWVKELDCVIENNARRTIDYLLVKKYDAYIPNNPDAPNNGWYEFGGGSVLIININGNSSNDEVILTDESVISTVQIIGPSRINRSE